MPRHVHRLHFGGNAMVALAIPTLPDDVALVANCRKVPNCPLGVLCLQLRSFSTGEGVAFPFGKKGFSAFTVNTESDTIVSVEREIVIEKYIGHKITVIPYDNEPEMVFVVIWKSKDRLLSVPEAETLSEFLRP